MSTAAILRTHLYLPLLLSPLSQIHDLFSSHHCFIHIYMCVCIYITYMHICIFNQPYPFSFAHMSCVQGWPHGCWAFYEESSHWRKLILSLLTAIDDCSSPSRDGAMWKFPCLRCHGSCWCHVGFVQRAVLLRDHKCRFPASPIWKRHHYQQQTAWSSGSSNLCVPSSVILPEPWSTSCIAHV